jgi:hypothetical protein
MVARFQNRPDPQVLLNVNGEKRDSLYYKTRLCSEGKRRISKNATIPPPKYIEELISSS